MRSPIASAIATSPEERAACVAPSNLFDAIVALDLTTGAVEWAHKALPDDAWNVSCGIYFIPGLDFEVPGCPDTEGPDYDFGQGPALFTVKDDERQAARPRRRGPEERRLLGTGCRVGFGGLEHAGWIRRVGGRLAMGIRGRWPARVHRECQQRVQGMDSERRLERWLPRRLECTGRRDRRDRVGAPEPGIRTRDGTRQRCERCRLRLLDG